VGITKCALNCQFYLYKFLPLFGLSRPDFQAQPLSAAMKYAKFAAYCWLLAKFIYTRSHVKAKGNFFSILLFFLLFGC